MDRQKFTVHIRSGEGAGADLSVVLARLSALEELHEAIVKAVVSPGASRGALSDTLQHVASLRVTGAEPTGSLAVAVSEPELPPDYDGDFAAVPPAASLVFRKTVRAAATRSTATIIELFPEKADQFRVLKAVGRLAPRERENPVLIEGLDPHEPIIFREEHREWAEANIPSVEPEERSFTGMIRSGQLGQTSNFKLYDGARTITLKPTHDDTEKLRDLFGKVVRITGLAHFKPDGVVREITGLTSIDNYQYVTDRLSDGETRFKLVKPIVFAVEAGLDAKSFTLTNTLLGTVCFGRTLQEATSAVGVDFGGMWQHIAKASDESLHPSARALKAALLQMVESVEAEDVE